MITYYGKSFDEGKKYGYDLRYWSNACGELHQWGTRDIKFEELPEQLQDIYEDRWEEGKDGNYCYLVEYKGEYGIALVNEYWEHYDGKISEDNYEQAVKAAKAIDSKYGNIARVIVAQEQGFPEADESASEMTVFVPAMVDKDVFNEISKYIAEVAYKVAA